MFTVTKKFEEIESIEDADKRMGKTLAPGMIASELPKDFENKPVKYEEHISVAAGKFDEWMKDHEESHRRLGNLEDNNKALISFLNGNYGFKYIKTYEQLCQLATLLQKMSYKTTNPPCSPLDFAREIEDADPRSFRGEKPIVPKRIAKQLDAEQRRRAIEMDGSISRRVKDIENIKDDDTRMWKTIAFGTICRHRLFKDLENKSITPDLVTIERCFRELDEKVRYYSQVTPPVSHGSFAGQLPRNLREINMELAKIENHDCSMAEGLKNIIWVAHGMGNHHPILVTANRCYGLVNSSIQDSIHPFSISRS